MTALSQIKADFDRLGLALPKPLVAAQTASDTFLAAVPRDVGNPVGAALDAIERGDDPYGPEVQRQICMARLTEMNLPHTARLRADGKVDDALAANADTILSVLAEHLVPHAEAMAAAHQLGVSDLHEARTLRGAQLAAWGNAASAAEQFAVANQIVGVLLRAMHRQHDKLRVLAAATPDKLQAARNILAADNRISPAWALTVTGCTIAHIRTLAELDQRDILGVDGVVEPLEPDNDDQHQRPRAGAVSN